LLFVTDKIVLIVRTGQHLARISLGLVSFMYTSWGHVLFCWNAHQ